jgi:thiol-disulfide isomerase/thioredoxin
MRQRGMQAARPEMAGEQPRGFRPALLRFGGCAPPAAAARQNGVHMSEKMRTALLIAAFALFIATAFLLYHQLGGRAPGIEAAGGNGASGLQGAYGQEDRTEAYDFTMTDSEGGSLYLSDMFGKPVVLNFWASWCPPCKEEMPEFDRVYQELGGEIHFIMLDLTDGARETEEDGRLYIEEQGLSLPIYFDSALEGATAYGIQAIPSTFFIDKDGYIAASARGAIDEATLLAGIELIK